MYQINRDAPWIEDADESGLDFCCPICGEECSRIVVNENGECVGCENCLHYKDAEDYYAPAYDSDKYDDFYDESMIGDEW